MKPNHCLWDGDCDHCGWAFCIATASQAAAFYKREEKESRRKWGRGLGRRGLKLKLSEQEKNEIMDSLREGAKCQDLAVQYGCSEETIRNYKKKLVKEEKMEEQKEVVVREGSELEKLKAEIKNLKNEVDWFKDELTRCQKELAFKNGMIEGLKYAVRGREEGWTGTN